MESLLTILAFVVGAMLLIFETTLNEEKFYLCFAKSIAYYLCIYGIVSAILLVFNFFDVLLASVISVVFCLIFVIFRAVVLGKISKLFSIKRIVRDIKNSINSIFIKNTVRSSCYIKLMLNISRSFLSVKR